MTPDMTPEADVKSQPEVELTLVITLRNGVQIRAGVTDVTIRADRATGGLNGLDWTLNGDPHGNSIGWVDVREVVAVHYERMPRS